MKKAIAFSALFFLLLGLQAQSVIYLDGKPTSDWEHHMPKNRTVNLTLNKPLEVRFFSANLDAKTDQLYYTAVSQDSALIVKPHPDKPGWCLLTAVAPVKTVRLYVYVQAKKPVTYKVPVIKGTDTIAKPDENGRFDKQKITWSLNTIDEKGMLLDNYLFRVLSPR